MTVTTSISFGGEDIDDRIRRIVKEELDKRSTSDECQICGERNSFTHTFDKCKSAARLGWSPPIACQPK